MIEEPIKYIQKVEIQGLFGRYDIEWNLNKDVNVLAGINGSGKTTILNRVYNTILRHSITKEDIKKIENLSLTFDNKAVIFKTERSRFYACLFGIKLDIVSTFDTELNLYNADIKKRSDEKIKTELDLKLFDLQKEYLNYQVNLGKKLKANKGHPDDNSTYFQDRFLEIIDELFSETSKIVNRDKNEVEFLLGDKEITLINSHPAKNNF